MKAYHESFHLDRKNDKSHTEVTCSGIVTRNKLKEIDDQVDDDPMIVIDGDSFGSHQDDEFCRKGAKCKLVVSSGRRIEAVAERTHDLVPVISEETVFSSALSKQTVQRKAGQRRLMTGIGSLLED